MDTFQPKIFGSKLEKIIIVEYRHQWRPFIRDSIPNAVGHWMMIRLRRTQQYATFPSHVQNGGRPKYF